MVDDELLWDVTIDVVLGVVAISVGQVLGGIAASAFGFLGIILYAVFALASLVIGVYLVVRGAGKLVEEIVWREVRRLA
ncbi:hypothetical protein [Haladaptatus sp. DYF46]|uniref:hypothetical protein n=1 Tax=Haladaptatus sp. DYF46 TaxID=2886041 RepID=UPI001E4B62A1|nr:hypothetical protein [Haladaptatus sp. DYF46]